jgi:YfiR/HmsC-like
MPLFIASRRLHPWLRLASLAALGCVIAVLVRLPGSAPAAAQGEPAENKVMATDLFNFGKFMRHSGGYVHHATFDICILGRDTIGRTIDDITSKETIDHLPVRVPRIADAARAKGCEIVFISVYEGDHMREDMAILAGADVLTVSDTPDFLERGGMIQFVTVANHVRFAVNLSALNRSHLALSSELLKVAVTVKGTSTSEVRP